jgi:O-antigen ligase
LLVWRYFPAIYALPFIFSTVQFSAVAQVAELMRWVVFAVALLFALRFNLRRMGFIRPHLTNLDVLTLFILLIFLASSVWSFASFYSLQKVISVALLLFSSFWTFWLFADRYSEIKLLRTLLFPIVLVLAANLTVSWFIAEPYFAGRFRGFFVNPNNIGILSIVSAGVAFTLWLRQRRTRDAISLMIILANLFLAASRSGLVVLGLIIVLSYIRTFTWRPLRGFMALLLIFGALFAFSQTSFFEQRILRSETLMDASNRVYFWELAKEYIAKRPMLGHGFGTDIIIHDHYGVVLNDMGLRGAAVMSSYYGLAIQMGIPFTVLFFAAIWGFTLFVLATKYRDFLVFHYAAIIGGGLLQGITEPLLFSAGNIFSFFFWIIFMLMYRRLTYRRYGTPLGHYGELYRDTGARHSASLTPVGHTP